VKLSEYYDIISRQADIKSVSGRSETYWLCPLGCTKKKINFGDTCEGCKENFGYYCTEKRIRTNEDLFGSDDESSEVWTC
jgi:hypothetical protein